MDGSTIYSGPVTTLDEPVPPLPDPNVQVINEMFTFTKDSSFSGSLPMTITVTNSPLLICQTVANFPVDTPDQANVWSTIYETSIGNVVYSDPFTNESIDGVPQSRDPDYDLQGQWWWLIPDGSTFSCDINIQASKAPAPTP